VRVLSGAMAASGLRLLCVTPVTKLNFDLGHRACGCHNSGKPPGPQCDSRVHRLGTNTDGRLVPGRAPPEGAWVARELGIPNRAESSRVESSRVESKLIL
jgi:hypothetical protein